ncbi:MAG: DUF2341 domain-containing protein, partial [Bacteroidota bacterium]
MIIEPKINNPSSFFRKNVVFLTGFIFFLIACNNVVASVVPGYSFYKKLTTQQTQISVGNTSLSNFPVLVRFTDNDLKHVSNGGKVQNLSGFDIVFTASDTVTVINHQLEKYDPVTGEVVAWVQLPSLSATVNTDFFIFFGNSLVILNPSTNVTWDSNFKGVWHLNSNQSDATVNLNNLTSNSTSVLSPGLAANGVSIAPAQSLSQITNPLLQLNGKLTLETWLKFSDVQPGVSNNVIISNGDAGELGANNYHYSLNLIGNGVNVNKLRFFWEHGAGTDVILVSTAPASLVLGTWHHVAAVRDTANGLVYFYFDGAQLGSALTFTNLPDQGLLSNFQIGRDQNNTSFDIDAGFDEVRISNSVRIPEWIQATYENIRTGSTFVTFSTTSCVPPPAAVAGPNQTLCISTPTTLLAGSIPTLGTGAWALVSGSGSISAPGSAITIVSGLGAGPNIFSWTISNGLCTSVDQVTITVDALPGAANAGSDQTLCISSPGTNLNATPALGGMWSVIQGSGSIANPLLPNTAVTNMSLGINVLQWTVLSGICASNTDTMVIQVDDTPTPAFLSTPNETLCAAGSPSTVLTATPPTVGTGTWTFLQGTGTLSNANLGTSNLTGIVSPTTILKWTVSNGTVCASSSATMTIVLDPAISNPTISPVTQTICG